MKLSTRSTYGMRALVELVLTGGHSPVSASRIAKRQELSVAYLEQLLHRLRREGVVTSIRGPRGGYTLAKDPRQIAIGDVVRILDGEGRNGNGTSRAALRPEAREGHRHAQRVAQAVWRALHERLTHSLDGVTLQDLCDEVRTDAGEPLDHRYVFHI